MIKIHQNLCLCAIPTGFLCADFDSHLRSTIKAMRRTPIIKTFTVAHYTTIRGASEAQYLWCFQSQRIGEWPSLRSNAIYSFQRMNNPGFLDHTKVLLVFPESTQLGRARNIYSEDWSLEINHGLVV